MQMWMRIHAHLRVRLRKAAAIRSREGAPRVARVKRAGLRRRAALEAEQHNAGPATWTTIRA